MRASHVLAAVFVVVLAVVLWLANGGEPVPDAGPTQPKSHAKPAAVETSGNRRSLVEDAGEHAAPSADSSEQPSATGNLHVVVRNERGDTLAGCAVSAAEQDGITDATGSVTFTVAAGSNRVGVEPPAGSQLRGRSGLQTVRAGSTTELTIVLGQVGNMRFWAQLVAAEDGRALPGFELFVEPDNILIRSDAEGFAQTVIVNDDTWIDARAAGRCQCRIVPEAGHETRATALRVRLTTGATLSVQVLDTAATPVAGVGLELRLDPWQLQFPRGSRARGKEFVWLARSDLGGQLSFAGLPIGMTFHVTTRATDSFAALEEQRWTLTSAQEERIITLARASGVHGTVTDESGAAVADVAVQANVPEGPSRPRALREAEASRRTRTASDGSFRLGGLGAGLWWVGISYRGKYQPTSVSVEVPAMGSAQVALQAIAGLPVAGRAFAPDGSAASGVFLQVGIDDMFIDTGQTDDEGRFRFANLPAGPCELRIHEAFTHVGFAEPMTIEAGDENVELRLQAVNGNISGRAIGSSDVRITGYRRDSHSVLSEGCELDGSFFCRGLRAGTWDLTAVDRTGRAACVAGVQVLVGRETAGVLLDLQPAAKIAPRHGKAAEFVVRNGEHVCCIDNLEPGAAGEARVPPGTWTVVFRLRGKELSRREVTVKAGEERIVDGDR